MKWRVIVGVAVNAMVMSMIVAVVYRTGAVVFGLTSRYTLAGHRVAQHWQR